MITARVIRCVCGRIANGSPTGQLSISRRQCFGVLRTATTGRSVSPPLLEMMEVLGKDSVVSRKEDAVEQFSAAG